jgi:hypothetical protein
VLSVLVLDREEAAAALAAAVFASDADMTATRPKDIEDQRSRKGEEPEPVHVSYHVMNQSLANGF